MINEVGKKVSKIMTNENNIFTSNYVLFADILGISKLTLEKKEEAEDKLKKFGEIYIKLISEYEQPSKRFSRQFSDSIVVGFKEIKDAISFSKTLFRETFQKEIHLRGTIGVGEFTHEPDPDGTFSSTTGSGLVLASFADKYHVKGHTLLLVSENNRHNDFRGFGGLSPFFIQRLPKEFNAYIIRWWEKSDILKNDIEKRINGLTIEDLIYFEATKENINQKYSNEIGDIYAW